MRETTEFRELMEEPPGGENAGRVASANPDLEGRHLALGVDESQAHEYVIRGGWTLVTTKDGERAGLSAHRGILRGDEHVDDEAVRGSFFEALGFTREEVAYVYRQGRLTTAQAELRARIDARLLGLSRSGANMTVLARLLGFKGPAGRWPTALTNAISRARLEELSTTGRAA